MLVLESDISHSNDSHFFPSRCSSFIRSLQKILTMIPTEEEKQRIQEAQLINPDVPLGSAEQFLLTLSSITELSARLQLWAFKMDYELTEKVRHQLLPSTSGHTEV